MSKEPLLSVRDLRVSFRVQKKLLQAVRGVSFDLHTQEILGIVGESGCGKTAMAKAIVQLLPIHSSEIAGEALFNSENLLSLKKKEMEKSAWKGDRDDLSGSDDLSQSDHENRKANHRGIHAPP